MHMTEDQTILGASQTAVLVGAVICIDNRYLLVQEAKDICRGKWNFPGGHLKPGESIIDGTIREVREETGHDIKLTGLCPLINCVSKYGTLILIPFTADIVGTPAQPNPKEITDTRFFTRAQIANMRDELRFPELAIDLLNQLDRGAVAPLDFLRIYQ